MTGELTTTAKSQCEELVADRFPEGLVRTLEGKFPGGQPQDYEDAVSEGFVAMLTRGDALDNPHGFITTVAVHSMLKRLRRAAREQLPESEPDEDEGGSQWSDPTADQAISESLFTLARDIVEKWESRNVRTTTLLVLEAGRLGEPMSSAELAEELESQLDHEVRPDTARQWRKRGLDRLREELHAVDLWTERN